DHAKALALYHTKRLASPGQRIVLYAPMDPPPHQERGQPRTNPCWHPEKLLHNENEDEEDDDGEEDEN
ncbi:hypothetical protein, partial [Mycobacterium saskatchewanense]|uniref:hypothetical protein n=1 Tax=Mycobacterium saskatchewanense TaxID=220927 RepID=UPI001150A38C